MAAKARVGPRCTSSHERAGARVRCMKRPHKHGAHVGTLRDGRLEWWGATAADVRAELALLAPSSQSLPADNAATPVAVVVRKAAVSSQSSAHDDARAKGFTGEVCTFPDCGSMDVVKNGTCGLCLRCGRATGGCG